MVRISKRKVPENLLLKIYQLFFEVVSRSNSKDEFLNVIDDIISIPEKIMLAKRIGIIYLIIKGVEPVVICSVLKVSKSTVSKFISTFYNKESKLRDIVTGMIRKERVLGFIDDLFMELFNQPGIKIGHWQSYWDHKRRQDKRETI